ncbi:hypothetical protein AB1L07_25020 [Niallia alba]|uniref:Uncharacterized protein n=1 Tax=Niallia circulans TaxID=1397 RepID=A0A941GH43_NIACI|nr:hypothetical protein [Niallia circulans]MCB5238661.1 hypothetical protein [Niallia circulans]
MKLMKYSKTLLIMTMLLPWITAPLLGKDTLKRYLPASAIMTLIVRLTNVVARRRKWWWWYERIHPKIPGDVPFMFGPFFVSSIWILKWTYGKFFNFLALNIAFESIFTYVLLPYFTKFGIASIVRLPKMKTMALFTVLASILYALQFLYDNIPFNKQKKNMKLN